MSRRDDAGELLDAAELPAMVPNHNAPPSRAPDSGVEGQLLHLPLPESDAGLVAALRAGRDDARAEIVRRCTPDVERVLYRVLGPDSEIEDLAHDVFVAAFVAFDRLRQPSSLRSFLISIAIRKARRLIRRRTRWRFVASFAPAELPEREAAAASLEVTEALRTTYRILAGLPVDDRIAFTLRAVDGMDLKSVAEVTEVSLATAKRRIARAERQFLELAKQSDILSPWLEPEGTRS
ncbi:MAG TPA: sigma-70 family RNA polymerase sigma factor [Polyangiaceae bacterium]